MIAIKKKFPSKTKFICCMEKINNDNKEDRAKFKKYYYHFTNNIQKNIDEYVPVIRIICPKCESIFTLDDMNSSRYEEEIRILNKYSGDWIFNNHYGDYKDDYRNGIIWECPKCNKKIEKPKLYPGSKEIYEPSSCIIYDNGDKISISFMFRRFMYVNKNNYYSRKNYTIRITHNKNSGQWYIFPIKTANKKIAKELYTTTEIPMIENITYNSKYFFSIIKMREELLSPLVPLIIKVLNINLTDKNKRKLGHYLVYRQFKYITLVTKIPQLQNYDIKQVMKFQEACNESLIRNIFQNIKPDDNITIFFNKLFSNIKLPNVKILRKLMINDMRNISHIYNLRKIGFKDVNIIKNLLCNIWGEILISDYVEGMPIFTKDMIKAKGEYNAYQKIKADMEKNIYIYKYVDIEMMYVRIKNLNIENNEAFTYSFSGNLQEIHDELALIFPKITQKNIPIKYNDSDDILIQSINDYEYNLPQDTHTLIDIGNEMGICVGSYDKRALNRECIIVSVKHNNKYVGCIELSPKYKLKQAKTKYNYLFDTDNNLLLSLEKWITNCNIDATNCYDYEKAKRIEH